MKRKRYRDINEIDVIKNLDLAMNNSYKLLTNKNSFDDLVIGDQVFFAHDIDLDLSEVDFDFIIEYFSDDDDFEKCIELKKIKDKYNNN
jgi:hypothetical protein